ncbi:hypothetical protein DNTS_026781 [Danionella cerebrum]|uniref:BPTI/Kunitz inhibitor domain-containing protein n=1 Tax=Danionella cerebrum TaxID=2873325 RepID=A0A553N5X6_9TELE|nr:hypothetical protein DNTS_026781 [Danionella translucida]
MRRSTSCLLLLILGFTGAQASSLNEGKGKEKYLKFFYDPSSQSCVPFFYKGEGGSSNRFDNDQDCMRACSPNALLIYPTDETSICSLPKDEGFCMAALPKYYYDNDEKNCRMFLYRGCRGNANRFETREDCQKMCLARSGRLMGAADLPNPDEKTVDAGLIVGILGGIVFAGAVISAIVFFVLRRKTKKQERVPVPTTDIEMK